MKLNIMQKLIRHLSRVSPIPLICLTISNTVSAQIIPDNTLPINSSITPGCVVCTIDGGTVRGVNLFHSFQEFSIPTGGEAFFNNALQINNIFTRITGNSLSDINGLIRANGTANLFILNPNGIIFGENARLEIGGDFFASTANSWQFADGSEFSATNPQAPPLLTVNVTPGLQYGGNNPPQSPLQGGKMGNIANAGNLAVNPGQTIALYGNQVTSTGNLTAPGGTVMVLGERIGLFDNASIDISSDNGGGTVLIGGGFQGEGYVPNAARTFVDSGVTINADANQNGDGGNVIVWANEVTGFYGNISARGGIKSGNGGLVEVSGKEHLIFRGTVDNSAVNGLWGTLLLDPTDIIIANGSGDSAADGTNTFAGNNSKVAGAILSAPLSAINDTGPTTIYESELERLAGNTNVILQATNDIRIRNLADNNLRFTAGNGSISFTADADSDGVGAVVMADIIRDTINTNGRNITISGASLTLGSIRTSSVNGGAINLTASGDITINGSLNTSSLSPFGNGGAITLSSNFGNITAKGDLNSYSESGKGGNGGAITLSSNSGNITTGSLKSYSYSESGNAGNGGTITLSSNFGDITTNGYFDSSSESDLNAGNGGAITLSSGEGDITTNDYLYSYSYSYSGNTGNGGAISLTTNSGDITTNDYLKSYSYSNSGNTGNGGAISLTTNSGDITTRDYFDSSSESNSGNAGNGGTISLTTNFGDITTNDYLYSYSYSYSGNAGNGEKISLSAGGGNIIGHSPDSILFSFALSSQGTAGSGGKVTLEAFHNIDNLEIFTLSSANQAGEVLINGLGDLSINNTRILTSRRVEVTFLTKP